MNRRIEPRFQVYSSVKLTLLDDPEREELDCLLVDISGSGMRLVCGVELEQGRMVCVEAGEHVVLADVRHCSPRGGRFAIGVERVHTVPKPALAGHPTSAAKVQALVESYRVRIREGLDKGALLEPGLMVGKAAIQILGPPAAESKAESNGAADLPGAAPAGSDVGIAPPRHLEAEAAQPESREGARSTPEENRPSQPPLGSERAFGDALSEIRAQHGISQEQLARESGLDRTYVGMVEGGSQSPTLRSVVKLARALGVRVSDIILRMEARAGPNR
jgi:DNA-binding XRE family transcriptional regulator